MIVSIITQPPRLKNKKKVQKDWRKKVNFFPDANFPLFGINLEEISGEELDFSIRLHFHVSSSRLKGFSSSEMW